MSVLSSDPELLSLWVYIPKIPVELVTTQRCLSEGSVLHPEQKTRVVWIFGCKRGGWLII